MLIANGFDHHSDLIGVIMWLKRIGEEPGNGRGFDLDKVVFGILELVVNVLLLAIRPEPVPTLH